MEYRYIVRNSRGSLFDFEKEAIIYLGLKLKKNNAKIVKVIKKDGEVDMSEEKIKRIIINKIDVTECDFLNCNLECDCVDVFMYEKYKYMNNPPTKCRDIPSCYYKQLQTAKEENKTLTQQNKQMREALEKIITEGSGYEYGDTEIAQQAIKGGE